MAGGVFDISDGKKIFEDRYCRFFKGPQSDYLYVAENRDWVDIAKGDVPCGGVFIKASELIVAENHITMIAPDATGYQLWTTSIA